MAHDSRRSYFENQVLTASPQRLHYMLLSSALQSARKAKDLLEAGSKHAAGNELAHAEAILTDIVFRMRKDLAPALIEKAAAVYVFMLRRLTESHLHGDVQGVRDAIRVLEVEQETWRLASERGAQTGNAAPPPHLSFNADTAYEGGGLTLEA